MVKKFGNKDFLWTTVAVLVIASAALATGAWITAHAPKDDGSYVPFDVEITPEMKLLQEYIRLQTTPGKEILGAEFLSRVLGDNGIESEIVESSPGYANVYARIEGRRKDGGLLLLSHIDVKEANPDEWQHPPFGGDIDLNILWGRGSIDMKSITICHLEAFIDVATSGKQPEVPLVFLATADEERGSSLGTEWVTANRPEWLDGISHAITEGGITETIRENLVYFAIESGSKQFVRYEARSSSREALEAIKEELAPDFDKPNPEVVLPEVREYFRAVAKHRPVYGELLLDIDSTIADGRFAELPLAYRMLTQDNVYVVGIWDTEGGYVSHFIETVRFDRSPDSAIEEMEQRLAGFDAEIRVLQQSSRAAVPSSPTDTDFFAMLADVARSEWGSDADIGPFLQSRGGTDCRIIRTAGIDCYGFPPFLVDFFQSQSIHGVDERVRLDWFQRGVDVTTRLTKRAVF